jgi:hypothetical protein
LQKKLRFQKEKKEKENKKKINLKTFGNVVQM